MNFKQLYNTCLIKKTSYKDKGTSVEVSIKPEKGEEIYFFPIYDDKNENCNKEIFQKSLKMKEKKVCDLIVFYSKGDKQTVCLVELKKGSNADKAADQILSVLNCFKPFLDSALKNNSCCPKIKSQQIEWRAYIICKGGSAHSDRQKKARKKLEKSKKFSAVDIKRDSDLGKFLRK
ncbi:MAG: hypothetical protein GY795_30145 [Desulfobacterales bacterium]|nr:hypothetical protein [Desulfobacterales bacterium]